MFVRDRMSRDPEVVRPGEPLRRTIQRMEDRGFEAPVVGDGRLAGIVTHCDILRAQGRAVDPGYLDTGRVGEVMPRRRASISWWRPVSTSATSPSPGPTPDAVFLVGADPRPTWDGTVRPAPAPDPSAT